MKLLRHVLVRLIASTCKHPRALVVADLTEGDSNYSIAWCRACGSIKRGGWWDWPVDVRRPGRACRR